MKYCTDANTDANISASLNWRILTTEKYFR